jgi:hypothetical protein
VSESHSEIHKTGHRWIDLSVAACALVVSITSLGVAVHHGHTMERMADANARLVAANSWPILQRFSSNVGTSGGVVASLNVKNDGVGPAKVEWLELSWEGRPLRNVQELIDACCHDAAASIPPAPAGTASLTPDLPDLPPGMQISSLQGEVLRAGEERRLYELPDSPANSKLALQLSQAFRRIGMRACYCSVFDECWVTDLRTLSPEPVQRCVAPAVLFSTR